MSGARDVKRNYTPLAHRAAGRFSPSRTPRFPAARHGRKSCACSRTRAGSRMPHSEPASSSHPNQSSRVAWYAEVANSYDQPFQAYFRPTVEISVDAEPLLCPGLVLRPRSKRVSLHGCAIEATSLPPGASTSWIDRSTFGISGMSCSARQEVTMSKDSASKYSRNLAPSPLQVSNAQRRSDSSFRACASMPGDRSTAVTVAPRRAISRAK